MPVVEQIFTGNALRNFNYLVRGRGGKVVAIDPFDATLLSPRIRKNQGRLIAIINTHEHADHTMGNADLVQEFQAPVYAHPKGEGKIPKVQGFLEDGDEIAVDSKHCLRAMDTPGHTHAHLCLLLLKNDTPCAIFTGDTLFNAGVGNCYNGGNPEILYETICHRFMSLPDDILVYPGHEYLGRNLDFTLRYWPSNDWARKLREDYRKSNPDRIFFVTTMGEEKEINPFLRTGEQEILDNIGLGPVSEKQVFLTLRELRNRW